MQITDPPRFLLDENLSPEFAAGLQRRDAKIDVLHIPGPGAPAKGTSDPAILLFCEAEHRALVTNNRMSMPGHIAALAAEGHHHWGVFQVRNTRALGEIIDELHLLWGASDASEHIDRIRWIPE